jgi:zinc/manganese transport system substrate-binding protein
MVPVIAALTDALVAAGVDEAATRQRSEAYATELEALDAELEDLLAALPVQRRVLVTNHEVLAYFADRYGFEVIGTVIPSVTTGAAPSTAAIEALAELIDDEGVPAIFAETSSPSELARALADLAEDDVAVVELFTESLGDEGSGVDTYLGLLRTDAQRIHDALAP